MAVESKIQGIYGKGGLKKTVQGIIDFLNYFWEIREMVFVLTVRHAWMALAGVVIGTLTAVPIGIAISRKPQASAIVID